MGPFDMNYEEVANGAILNKKKPESMPAAQGIAAAPAISSAPVIAAPQAINSIASVAPSVSLGSGQKPTIFDNGGLPADVVQRGIDTMRSQMVPPQITAPVVLGQVNAQPVSPNTNPLKNVVDTSSGPTVSDGAGGVYTPERGSNPIAAAVNMFKDSAQAARGDKSYEQIRAEREAASAPASVQPVVPGAAQAPGQLQSDPLSTTTDKFPLGVADNKFITGHNGAMPDSSGGGFTQGKTSYNVNPSGQDGITKVTAQGKNPLYTNIKPEDAVAGLNNQSYGGNPQEGLDRMARANATRQEMINAQITQPSPTGIAAPPVDQTEIDNAEKTKRWAIENAVASAPANQRAALTIQAMNHDQSNQTAQRGQDKASATADAHNNVTMRGQDIGSRTDANRIAVENPLKQAQTQGILAQNDSSKMLADLQRKALSGDVQAMASYQAITGKKATPATDRYMTVTGGEEVGPDGMTKVKKPSGVFDAQTGQFVQMGGGQQAGPSQADLEHTAKKYGMTVEQVKAKLAQQQGAK